MTTDLNKTHEAAENILNHFDVIIIGGGVAGLSAGVYTARDGFSTLIIEGDYVSNTDMPGGALLLTPDIENFPGFVKGEGQELISIIRGQAEKFGSHIVTELVETAEFAEDICCLHTITTNAGNVYTAKTVILATGAVARQLGVAGELDFIGHGVSTCATCDGFFYTEKEVVVVGGGDTAVEDALFLRRYADKVTMFVRGNEFRATGPDAREALELSELEDDSFNIIWNSRITSVNGEDGKVTSVSYLHDGVTQELKTDGMFVAIGRDPSTRFLQGTKVPLDEENYIVRAVESNKVAGATVGVFAAGDAVDKRFRQAATSAGRAVEAALEAREYLLTAKRG
jgi:thioredoxin reductase (NADPH)